MAEQMTRPAAQQARPVGEMLTYCPGEGDPHVTTWRGVEFKANVPTRVTDMDAIEVARGNRYFRVGDSESAHNPHQAPKDAMQYRGHVLKWMAEVSTVEHLVRHWAADRNLRSKLEVGQDDIGYLGTLIEPRLEKMRKAEGLNQQQTAELWIKHGVLELPWRA